MGFFSRKSEEQLRAEINELKRREHAQAEARQRENNYQAVLRERNLLKHKKLFAIANAAGHAGSAALKRLDRIGQNVTANVENQQKEPDRWKGKLY